MEFFRLDLCEYLAPCAATCDKSSGGAQVACATTHGYSNGGTWWCMVTGDRMFSGKISPLSFCIVFDYYSLLITYVFLLMNERNKWTITEIREDYILQLEPPSIATRSQTRFIHHT